MAGIRIVGSYLSPYVRKVLTLLHLKGLEYEIDPIVAFSVPKSFLLSVRCAAFPCSSMPILR